MQLKTKNGAKDILLVASTILRDGRPRKPLGKPRPKQQGNKLNLIAALRYAHKELGTTRRQYETALETLDGSPSGEVEGWLSKSYLEAIEAYDEQQLDTRQVIRALDKAAKQLC